jgi:hypothetical protein
MIYVQLNGGLGNIFFQIASIWTLAKDNDDELGLSNVRGNIAHMINVKNRPQAINYSYLLNCFSSKEGNIPNLIRHPFHYVPLEYKKECEYVGYFQCEKYFKHRRNEILELFKPTQGISAEVIKYEPLFGNICLHVRRGDYVNNLGISALPIKYYEEALSYLPKDMKVLIFSDDLYWCTQNFVGERFLFVNETDYVSVYLMPKMKHHIIANSSFSWWGAWMSEYRDKIVIAPKDWFGIKINVLNGDDVVPESWIKI